MAGGTWVSQNKKIPGVYINTQSRPAVAASVGPKGIVAIAKALSWGPLGVVQEITPGQDVTPYIGYSIASDQGRFLLEMTRGTDVTDGPSKIYLYRYAGTGGAKASATAGSLTATALYEGVRGNDLTIAVIADPDEEGYYDVQTMVEGRVVDTQHVSAVSELTANAWVTFSGSGLSATAGTALTGGTDPTVAVADDAAFLTAIEPYRVDIVAYDGTNQTVIAAYVAFIKRMNETVGRKCQLVIGNYAGQNTEYVISAQNGVKLADGSLLDAQKAVWWLAGSEAGAQYFQSLTYAQYPTAVAAYPKLTDDQAAAAVAAGQICFIDDFGVTKICSDVNTLTTLTPTKGAEYSKNRVMRVIMQLCNDTYEHFANYYIGKVDNDNAGRSLLRGWLVGYLTGMQANGGIQNFVADDVEVLAGDSIDAVLINVAIQPVDAIEKIYMSVTVSVAGGVTVAVAA